MGESMSDTADTVVSQTQDVQATDKTDEQVGAVTVNDVVMAMAENARQLPFAYDEYPANFFEQEFGSYYQGLYEFRLQRPNGSSDGFDGAHHCISNDNERRLHMISQLRELQSLITSLQQKDLSYEYAGEFELIDEEQYHNYLAMYQSLPLMPKLIPMSVFCENLRSELPAYQWDFVRLHSYQRSGYVCEICGGVGLTHPVECHENWHYDIKTNKQTLISAMCLCPSCHECHHLGFSLSVTNNKVATAKRLIDYLADINKITTNQATALFVDAFKMWAYLSYVTPKWDLDINNVMTFLDKKVPPISKDAPKNRSYVPLLLSF